MAPRRGAVWNEEMVVFKVPALIGIAAILGCLNAAQAQQPMDPRLAAATQAYTALPEAERKAIQSDLIWTGHLNSAATGNFGPLTFRAVNGFKAGSAGPSSRSMSRQVKPRWQTMMSAPAFAIARASSSQKT